MDLRILYSLAMKARFLKSARIDGQDEDPAKLLKQKTTESLMILGEHNFLLERTDSTIVCQESLKVLIFT